MTVSYTHLDVYKRQVENTGEQRALLEGGVDYALVIAGEDGVAVFVLAGFSQVEGLWGCLLYTSRVHA